jgi:hypothetical protein
MRKAGWRAGHVRPAPPHNAEGWLALPEIPFGRYLLADIGWISARRQSALEAGVAGLPRHRGGPDNERVALPAVIVVSADDEMRMFRLPVAYAAVVNRLALGQDRAWNVHGSQTFALPCHFVIGDGETVHLVADEQANRLN